MLLKEFILRIIKSKKYILLLSVYFFYSLSVFSQIVNEGTLYIETSTTVYFGDEYTNNGTHNSNGDLFLNSNFINNDSTSSTTGTTFFRSSLNNIQTISGLKSKVNFNNLSIDNNLTGVTVVDNFAVYVSNAVDLVDGDFRLTGEAQLIQTHNGTNANSSVSGRLLRDQQGNKSAYGYNYWSSPVNNGGSFSLSGGLFDGTDANINPFSSQQVQFNIGDPFNGLPSVTDGAGNVTTPLTLNSHWFFKFSRGTGSIPSWIKINENSSLNPGEAFIMKGTNTSDPNQNYVFKGEPNDGSYQFLSYTDEYILIGNPYPSAIDTDEFIKDNISVSEGGYAAADMISGTLYYWVEGGSSTHFYSGYLGGYATYNLTGGAPPSVIPMLVGGLGAAEFVNPPKRYMAVAQGFFVEGASNGNIAFKNSQRVFKTENSGESIHYKNINTKSDENKSIVRLGYEDPEGFHRQLVLGFLPNTKADLSYNKAYDAKMFGEREDELYFIIDNDLNQKYVIQGVGAFNELIEIPLGLKITEQGIHRIMLDATENFDETVYIKDKLLNTTHNLSESILELNISTGNFSDRYQIVFQPQSTLDINEFERNQINVYYNGDHSIIINNQKGLQLYNIIIYNVLGQKILQLNDNTLELNNIEIPFNRKEGVYFVKLETELGEGTFKILKNN